MEILLLQTDIKWLDPAFNRKHVGEIIKNSPKPDLIILPEMFTTGFVTSPEGATEPAAGPTLLWLKETSEATGAAIAGSVTVNDNGRNYNRFYFVKPDGSHTEYDKRHLFSFAGEHEKYTAGEERVIVELCGMRILLQVCYDLRFPVFSRNKGDYDMIIYVANWPASRRYAWDTLLRARAIENVCYVAGVNRVGSDPADNNYSGGTVLLDFLGQPIAEATDNVESAVSGSTDMTALEAFRKKFPALRDSDKFGLEL